MVRSNGAVRGTRQSHVPYFKHKYITQPSITAADAVIKALQDLAHAIRGQQNAKGTAQFNAIAKLQEAFSPGHRFVPEQYIPENRQQIQPAPRVEAKDQGAPPRVQFDHTIPRPILYDPDPRIPMDRPEGGTAVT